MSFLAQLQTREQFGTPNVRMKQRALVLKQSIAMEDVPSYMRFSGL